MQNKYFRLASEVAPRSTHRIKIGAVLVRKGQVLNVGYNKVGKTHPSYPWYLHAELDACLGIYRHDLSGSSIYLSRVNSLGIHGLCKPCTVCQSVLKDLGVKSVCYTTGYCKGDLDGWEPPYEEMKL